MQALSPLSPLNYDHVLNQIGYDYLANLPFGHTRALLKKDITTIYERDLIHRILDAVLSLFGKSSQQNVEKSIASVLKNKYTHLQSDPIGTAARAHRLANHLLDLTDLKDQENNPRSYVNCDSTFIQSLTSLFNEDFLAFSDPTYIKSLVRKREACYQHFVMQQRLLLYSNNEDPRCKNVTIAQNSITVVTKIVCKTEEGTTKWLQEPIDHSYRLSQHFTRIYLGYYPKEASEPTIIKQLFPSATSGFRCHDHMPGVSTLSNAPACDSFEAAVGHFHEQQAHTPAQLNT